MPLLRALRVVGYVLALLILAPEVTGWVAEHDSPHGPRWLAAYVVFLVAFHAGAQADAGAPGLRRRATSFGAAALSTIAMAAFAPCQFAALALVVVGLLGALVLRTHLLALLLSAVTALVGVFVVLGCGALTSVRWLAEVGGLEAAVTVIAVLAQRENRARTELAGANRELQNARALLADAAREAERIRIARDLHDALGHNLTALSLHLEVARNVSPEKAAHHLTKASSLADGALDDLRSAVRAVREGAGHDVVPELQAVCANACGLRVHLDAPPALVAPTQEHAHCILRCVEEIVTNALRHARAANLWIRIAEEPQSIVLEARDDGRGARRLSKGGGLTGMTERVRELGGQLKLEPQPVFSIQALLPLREQRS